MANIQKAILKTMIEDVIVELMVKSRVDNIYMEDGITTLASKLSAMLSDISSKANSADVTTQINTAINNLINGAPETYDTLKEIADYLATHQNEYTALVNLVAGKANTSDVEALKTRVETLENAGAEANTIEAIKVNGVTQTPVAKVVDLTIPTGSLANKSIVSESDLDVALKEKVNAASEGNHSHLNKEVLDTITQEDIDNWNKEAVYVSQSQPATLAAGELWIQPID